MAVDSAGNVVTGKEQAACIAVVLASGNLIAIARNGTYGYAGDAGAATLVRGVARVDEFIGPFVYGTDGGGARNLIVPTGRMRQRVALSQEPAPQPKANGAPGKNGPAVFALYLSENRCSGASPKQIL